MKIYTRSGDDGETGLFGGPRVRKDAARVEAYGDVDELNALIGVARAQMTDQALAARLQTIQSQLFDLGGELATPDVDEREAKGQVVARVDGAAVTALEAWIDALEAELEPLAHFILPGGDPAAAALQQARAVCRRAERRTVTLDGLEGVSREALHYLNRLSDLLFVLARVVNHRAGVSEPRWIGRERLSDA
ncbi:MAG: cob(I)yrinic acid a,c-diamide adenosyltransferase [Chloroflexi bacterium]|nr:cob(I)yrinic acid a,c-diamide adenosyltransferase [Chloroflexota bacterium]